MRTSIQTTAMLALVAVLAVFGVAALADDEHDCPKLFRLGEDGGDIMRLGSYGFLGVELTTLTPELRRHFGVPDESGVMIGRVEEGSPAAVAGLQVGDIITRLDDEDVAAGGRLRRVGGRREKGGVVPLEYGRDGRVETAVATLGERQRCGFDISHMLDLEHLPQIDLEHLPQIDLEHLPRLGHLMELHEFDGEALEEAMEKVHEALENQDWESHLERLRDADLSHIEERLHEAMERLHELEIEIDHEKDQAEDEERDEEPENY